MTAAIRPKAPHELKLYRNRLDAKKLIYLSHKEPLAKWNFEPVLDAPEVQSTGSPSFFRQIFNAIASLFSWKSDKQFKPAATPGIDPLVFTDGDLVQTGSNLIRWGLIGATVCGAPAGIIYPISAISTFASGAATVAMIPKDASLFRKLFPLLSHILSNANPWVGRFFQAASLYNLTQYTWTKMGDVLNRWKEDPSGALKAAGVYLFNLASGITFAAENAGLFKFRAPPSEKTDSPCQPDSREKCVREITIGSAHFNEGDPARDDYATGVDASHKAYAEKWNLKHTVIQDPALIKDQCSDPRGILGFLGFKKGDCSPYWLKIAAIKQWLDSPKNPNVQEEWRLLIDDDMPITNRNIDPNEAINALRQGNDASVIVAKDPYDWTKLFMRQPTDPKIAVNTGVFLVRKDDQARDFFNRVWDTRNTIHHLLNPYCPSLGMCKNQDALHEQQGAAMVLQDQPALMGRVVSIVPPRDEQSATRAHIALNTYHGHNNECFLRMKEGFSDKTYIHNLPKYNPSVVWRKGDWMGQVAALPVIGKQLPIDSQGKCVDLPEIQPSPIKSIKVNEMISQTV
ncbi:MAG: hypothetical protein K1X28_00070 [Parachlamydiales bacterium]|nr:hypothetical protein [Parachlamydiales bacterium]